MKTFKTNKRQKTEMDRDSLANIIKSLHRNLRVKCKKSGDPDVVWNEHCTDTSKLAEYSKAMKSLATEHWNRLSKTDPQTSRVFWIRNTINDYFLTGGINKARLHEKCNSERSAARNEKIKVLDVGSCYNPLAEFDELDVLAVDLCPAVDSVYTCDFLNSPVTETEENCVVKVNENRVTSLRESAFDCVVFCLLLEYFPAAKQRWDCCYKAYRILKNEGLLVIVTPDSKHANANARVMKSWREALGSLNLRRVKYEKLRHLHCMAFRKMPEDSRFYNRETFGFAEISAKMYIPQDLQEINSSEDEEESARYVQYSNEEILEGFSCLPCMDDL